MTRILYQAPSDHKWGEREIDYVLVIQKDVELNPNPNEVKECVYVGRSDLKGFLGLYTYLSISHSRTVKGTWIIYFKLNC